jgi:hypothetical protein
VDCHIRYSLQDRALNLLGEQSLAANFLKRRSPVLVPRGLQLYDLDATGADDRR